MSGRPGRPMSAIRPPPPTFANRPPPAIGRETCARRPPPPTFANRPPPPIFPNSAASTEAASSEAAAASTASSEAAATSAATASFRGVDHNHGGNPKSYDSSGNVLECEHRNLLLLFAGALRADVKMRLPSSDCAPPRRAPGLVGREKLESTVALPRHSTIRAKCSAEQESLPPFPYTIAVSRNLARELEFCERGAEESSVGTFDGIRGRAKRPRVLDFWRRLYS